MILETAFMCLALNIYHEARHLPQDEQVAVAHVVLNRVNDDRFPGSVCEVVKEGGYSRRYQCQFSWYCDGKVDTPYEKDAWEDARRSAAVALTVADPTGGALFYRAAWRAPTGWWQTLKVVYADKGHVYYISSD